MAKMKIAPKDRPKVKAECLRLLVTLNLEPARIQLISGFVDAYLRLTPEEMPQFQTELEQVEPNELKGEVMEIVTSWMEQGLEQGRQSEVRVLTKLLTRQVGQLRPEQTQQIEGLTISRLEQIFDQLPAIQAIEVLSTLLRDIEISEGFEGEKAVVLNQIRQQVGAIAPKQKQQLLALSSEQWQALAALNLDSIEALDSWLSLARTQSA